MLFLVLQDDPVIGGHRLKGIEPAFGKDPGIFDAAQAFAGPDIEDDQGIIAVKKPYEYLFM